MAFPASTQIQVDALQKARNAALQLKNSAQRRHDQMASESVEATVILTLLNNVRESITVFDEVAAVPGIDTYAQEQYSDTGLDVAAEFSAMRSAAVGVRNWIIANLPSDADGWLLLQTLDAQGMIQWRSFTPTQTAGLRTELDTLIATIS